MKRIAILVILPFLTAAYGCSCLPESLERSETAAIRDDFCWSTSVYVATVLEATCNCVPDPASDAAADHYCQSFSFAHSESISIVSVVDTYTVGLAMVACDIGEYDLEALRLHVRSCSEYDEQQFSGTNITATGALSPLVNNSFLCAGACPFFQFFQPCVYTVVVDQIFKDGDNNATVGDTLIVHGPDVQTSCGTPGRVLELGRQYVVGIGNFCNPVIRHDWTALSDYSSQEVELLEQLSERYANDPTFCAGPKLSLFHFSLPLLLTLIPLLLSS